MERQCGYTKERTPEEISADMLKAVAYHDRTNTSYQFARGNCTRLNEVFADRLGQTLRFFSHPTSRDEPSEGAPAHQKVRAVFQGFTVDFEEIPPSDASTPDVSAKIYIVLEAGARPDVKFRVIYPITKIDPMTLKFETPRAPLDTTNNE